MKEEIPQESWNKKRVLSAALVFIALSAICVYALVQANPQLTQKPSLSAVEGISIKNSSSVKSDIQDRVDTLQKEAQNINLVEMASSSPQVQKVINDLKALQDYPKNQLKNACEQICNNL